MMSFLTQRPQTPQQEQQQRQSIDQLREQIRENVRQQLQQAERQTRVRPVTPVAPSAPTTDGPATYVSVPPFAWNTGPTIPRQAVDISVAFFITVAIIIIGLPLARAFARRMDRRGGQVSGDIGAQLEHLSQAVDAIALEVERISEGQRFTTRLISEQREAASQSLPTGSSR